MLNKIFAMFTDLLSFLEISVAITNAEATMAIINELADCDLIRRKVARIPKNPHTNPDLYLNRQLHITIIRLKAIALPKTFLWSKIPTHAPGCIWLSTPYSGRNNDRANEVVIIKAAE